MGQPYPIVIVGGNSLITPYLLGHLKNAGLTAEIISRRSIQVMDGFTLTQVDLSQEYGWAVPDNAIVISLLPLWVLSQLLPRFVGVQKVIALGSTSRFSKANSSEKSERSTAVHLELAEEILVNWSERSGVDYVLLRSTMIYDGATDQNICRIAKFIRLFGFVPLAAPATGLRQPIHADDVAKAIIGCIGNQEVSRQAFNIAGGEILSYREMVERVFCAMGRRPRLLMLPTGLLRKAFKFASMIGIVRESSFGASIFQRMNEDLVFETAESVNLLNHNPREFGLTLSK